MKGSDQWPVVSGQFLGSPPERTLPHTVTLDQPFSRFETNLASRSS